MTDDIRPSPWDASVFGINAFEIIQATEKNLSHAAATPGHYTIKTNPLTSKELLHRYGFYYADTLIEPFCSADHFIPHENHFATKNLNPLLEELLPICENTFEFGRFHRDFNLPAIRADQRYKQWLTQLHNENAVIGLLYENHLAGFIAHRHGKLLLHAMHPDYSGRGLAKYLWTPVCRQLFSEGESEICSSVSAANLRVINLYVSLGFRFRNAVDVYHRLTG